VSENFKTKELATWQHLFINSNLIYEGLTLVFIVLWAVYVQALTLKNSSYGLELHWVQGDPIVILARLFLFLFTPYSNWKNWPKT